MANKTTAGILQSAKATLDTARLGLKDVVDGGPERRLGGLRNLVVFGRAVTNVLQNLRSTVQDFDTWYAPYQTEMREDPLLRYFYVLRSEILKEGTLRTSSSTYVSHFNFPQDMQRLGPPPPGARSFFMGDQAGGSGWEVLTDGGDIEKFYIDIPGDIATFEVHLPEAPDVHRGASISDKRVETLARLYFEYLATMVEDARKHFAHAA
jgi:hypothetical protein